MKPTKTEILNLVYDTIMKNTELPQFDYNLCYDHQICNSDNQITFCYDGVDVVISIEYK